MRDRDSHCPLGGFWDADEFESTVKKVEETHTMMEQLLEHTVHLEKLDNIAESISTIKGGLLSAATGKDQIPTKLATQLVKVMSLVILGLVVILVFALTGLHFGWIKQV